MVDLTTSDLIERSIAALERLRSDRPKIHVLTNFVAMNVSANAVLAVGAVPSMTIDDSVLEEFLGASKALVINLGQLDPWRKVSVPMAIATARRLGLPWVLDPVKIDRSGKRLALAHELMAQMPSVVRCNRGEFGLLEGNSETVLAVTGEVDHVTDGERRVDIGNGTPLMDRVTAMGCVASALVGAFLAVEDDHFSAVVAAVLVCGVAGEIAAEQAAGPGSFQPAFLDALYTIDGKVLRSRAKFL